MIDIPSIETALQALANLPLWGVGRAHSTFWFQFGNQTTLQSSKGGTRLVGDLALHIECPWRFVNSSGVITGSQDRWSPPLDELGDEFIEFDPQNEQTRFDQRIKTFFEECSFLIVKKINVDRFGGFQILLQDEHAIHVFPTSSQDAECWRLLYPVKKGRHLVLNGTFSELI